MGNNLFILARLMIVAFAVAFLIFLETAAPLRIASFTQKITGNKALSMNNQIRKYEATNCSRIAWYIYRLRSYDRLIGRVETGFVQIVSVKSMNLLPVCTYRPPFLQP